MQFKRRSIPLLLFCCMILGSRLCAQDKDSAQIKIPELKNKFLNNIFQSAISSISRETPDTSSNSQNLLANSERIFKEYEGKYIRHIYYRRFGFDQIFSDTTTRIGYFGTKLLNNLHRDTREFVIRNNMFLKEQTRLNPLLVSDNERFLRNIEFIQDARIVVIPTRYEDSVDLQVITKDLFSISGSAAVSGINNFEVSASEANLFGMGQKIQGTTLYQKGRTPAFGYEALYRKNNFGGSFINATIAYTVVNTGRSEGFEDEKAFYIKLDKPLITPSAHIAGGAELSFNQSANFYKKPDSVFYDYSYNIYDLWVGYNIGTRPLGKDAGHYGKDRDHVFMTARYVSADFTKLPVQIGDKYDPIYNNRKAILAEIIFFKQEFYKVNYLYGFGATEDVPAGYSVSVTGGYSKHSDLSRPYLGFSAERDIVWKNGAFFRAKVKVGGYYYKTQIQDGSILAGINYYTKILPVYKGKMRQLVKLSYTELSNRITYLPLALNNDYGLSFFNADSTFGKRRISAYGESTLYTNPKLFGFRFAPFLFAQAALISPEQQAFGKSDIFTGLGGGIRTRNENLIFGTIELRAAYFPRKVAGLRQFQIAISTNLRFRYNTNFINAPDVVQLNSDD